MHDPDDPTAAGTGDAQDQRAPAGHVEAFGGRTASETMAAAAELRTALTRDKLDLEQQQAALREELDRKRAELEADFAAQRDALAAQIEPMMTKLRRMEEVMWTVDLYLGRDEKLHLIRDGAPAPADTPITIRQRVLVMAEEAVVLDLDSRSIDDFTDWLSADPANLDRVLPEQRGVVVLVPTRVKSRSGNIFEDSSRDDANRQSWWLLRNGERLYLLHTDIVVGDRVLPLRKEFIEVFEPRLFGERATIEPGSKRWLELEEKADSRRRHFMRIMLVLQGIVDRTPVWHPLPPARVNLLSVDSQDRGKVVLIADAEQSIQLGDGRESFAEWRRRLNGQMRPGLRIIGDWNTGAFGSLSDRWDHPRLYPSSVANRPQAGIPHLIEDRRDGGFVIRYARTDTVLRENVPVPGKPGYVYRGKMSAEPQRRASCVVMTDDEWVLPFDLATTADLRYYLDSRDNRSQDFLNMVPTLRSAIAAKESEAAEEASFRRLLADQLINAGAEPERIDELVDELVQWWKVAHTWARPLNGAPDHERRAVRQILAEHASRRASATNTDQAQRMAAAGRAVPGAICVARNRRGQWHAYSPSTPAHDERVFLDITQIHADGTVGDTRTWQTVPQRSATLLQPAWSTDAWDQWRFTAHPRHYLTGPERDQLIDQALGEVDGLALCVVEFHNPTSDPGTRTLTTYHWTADQPPETAPTTDERQRDLEVFKSDSVTSRRYRVRKSADGVHLESVPHFYSHVYSPKGPGDGLPALKDIYLPWWPDGAPNYGVRPRLVWASKPNLTRLDVWAERARAERAAEARARDARWRATDVYVDRIRPLISGQVLAEVRARFDEDFPGAPDLWEAHLATLKINRNPIHRQLLHEVVGAALDAGHDLEGITLTELANLAGQPDPFGDRFGHIKIPPPSPDPDTDQP